MKSYLVFLVNIRNKTKTIRISRSQWPRVLRHEMSLPAQSLGSLVRIPLEAWMSVPVSSVFVLSCLDRGLATGVISV
jgi:hypothetical protein